MGSSASILSPEDFMLMSQDMKSGFDTLIEEGYTDDEIRSNLMEKYAKHLHSKTAAADVSAESAAIVSLDGTSADEESDEVDISTTSALDAVAIVGVDNNSNEEAIMEPKPALTEKAKKARKRRGTFENDKVVTSKAVIDVPPKVDEPVESVVG
jgi:hypothetical protein